MGTAYHRAVFLPNVSVPEAAAAGLRVTPRSIALFSSSPPVAVWANVCRFSQSMAQPSE
jgi:hypothetical protein